MTGSGIVILVVCAIGIYSILRWGFERWPRQFPKKLPHSSPKSFATQYIEDVLDAIRDRIKNPMPTIILWSLVVFFGLFKTAEQAFALIALITASWYIPVLFLYVPISRSTEREREREREKEEARSRLEHANRAKKYEDAMNALHAKWAKLEPEERRHQEMLHTIKETATRNQLDTDMAINSAVASLEEEIMRIPRGPYG